MIMPTSIIWITNQKTRFINYDYTNNTLPNNTEYITIIDLPNEIIEQIKKSTLEDVEKILSNYI